MASEKDPIDKLAFVSNEAAEVISPTTDGSSANSTLTIDRDLEKKALRKVDFWLVGFYSAVYIFRVIDSSNYSNTAIVNLEHGTGIKKQLGLTPGQWAWTLSIFSYSYMIFEPPNTLLLKYFTPSRWMFVLILAWGVSACSSAAVQDFKGMMVVRFAIGMAEAGFYPAVLYRESAVLELFTTLTLQTGRSGTSLLRCHDGWLSFIQSVSYQAH